MFGVERGWNFNMMIGLIGMFGLGLGFYRCWMKIIKNELDMIKFVTMRRNFNF